jgi:hypothetical protein
MAQLRLEWRVLSTKLHVCFAQRALGSQMADVTCALPRLTTSPAGFFQPARPDCSICFAHRLTDWRWTPTSRATSAWWMLGKVKAALLVVIGLRRMGVSDFWGWSRAIERAKNRGLIYCASSTVVG